MKLFRLAVLAILALLFAVFATQTPLAQSNPASALVAAAVIAWGVSLALNDVRSPLCRAVTVPDGLKLDRILNTALVALKRRLLPIMAFSTVFRDVMLQGTDIVQVPFVPLDQTASLDFDYDIGYESGDGTLETRPVQINRRKYQPLAITGQQLARQPILELEKIMVAKANQLAEDIINDIFSVVTLANFGAAVFTGASSGFDSDDIITIRKALENAMWPVNGRSLILNTDYDAALLTDSAVKAAYAFGGSEAIREGKVPKILGLDYYSAPILPGNAENLVGIASLPFAILIGFAPIEPPPGARKVMVDYRTVSDDNGLTLEYREFGDAKGDTDYRIIECNYGFAKGDAAQLKRLTSA